MSRVTEPTDAPIELLLAPAWRRPLEWLVPLSAYVVAAPPEGRTRLVLDGRDPILPADMVASLVERACGYLSEGAPFAEVVLMLGDEEPGGHAEPVADADALIDRLGLRVRPLRQEPREVVLHARWVKALVDDLQLEIDRTLLARADRPRLSGAPLVTVRIPTFGSAELLVERAIPSVLAGAYRHIEVLVCSDGPQPHARAAVEAVEDPRVRYIELEERPVYPKRPRSFWHVAGTSAVNRLVEEARGELIAPLDHDDAFTVDHIPRLLGALRRNEADFAYGQAMTEWRTGAWNLVGAERLAHGHVVHAAVMYTRALAHMRYDPDAWLLDEPGDWNLWRRMRDAGAAIAHVPAPVAVHFREGSSMEGRDPAGDVLSEAASDVLDTGARALLAISSHARGALLGHGVAGNATTRPPRRRREPQRRLALLDGDFPLWLSGLRYHEARELLEQRPDTVFFSDTRTGEAWNRPVYPLTDFDRIAGELGITDAYCVFLNFTASILGLQDHPGAGTCGGLRPGRGVASVLERRGIRLHATLYSGGGLVADTDPELLRAVAARCATIFTNTAEVVAAVPEAIRIAGPVATEHYAFRPREREHPFRAVFAADDRPRKGLDTALEALGKLDDRFHLHVVGPYEHLAPHVDPSRATFHGVLTPAETRGVYWSCDAFVSPVRQEGPDGRPGEAGLVDGFPTTTACEALASGCALVSSNPRAEHWIVEPERHFVEFPVQDAEALAAALVRLDADRDLRDAIAARGAAQIREVMDVRRVVAAKLQAMELTPA